MSAKQENIGYAIVVASETKTKLVYCDFGEQSKGHKNLWADEYCTAVAFAYDEERVLLGASNKLYIFELETRENIRYR
jgi:hypothetical protein